MKRGQYWMRSRIDPWERELYNAVFRKPATRRIWRWGQPRKVLRIYVTAGRLFVGDPQPQTVLGDWNPASVPPLQMLIEVRRTIDKAIQNGGYCGLHMAYLDGGGSYHSISDGRKTEHRIRAMVNSGEAMDTMDALRIMFKRMMDRHSSGATQ